MKILEFWNKIRAIKVGEKTYEPKDGVVNLPSPGIIKQDPADENWGTVAFGLVEQDPTTSDWGKVSSIDNVYVDDTLSIEGAAADAKKTGESIGQLKGELGDLANLDFDAENMVDAVNKAYNHGGGGGGSAYVDGQIVVFGGASVNGKVVII